MSTHNICFYGEGLLMCTQNIHVCFYGELDKIIPELSSNTPPCQVLCESDPSFLFPGVDDVFVFINVFRQADHIKSARSRTWFTIKTAGKATFFTSFTTAAAFAANIASMVKKSLLLLFPI